MQHKLLDSRGYVLIKSKLTPKLIDAIKHELDVSPIVHPDYIPKNPVNFPIYTETDQILIVPRYYGVKLFGPPTNINLPADEIKIQFNGTVRPNQVDIVESCIRDLRTIGGGVLSLYCGCGKTVLAIYLAVMLGVKTLVVVHKTFLLNQWIERIKQFTNARIGVIRQKKIDVADKDIVIAMLQSVSMIDYDPKIFNGFGLVIYDECHHVGSKVFSRAMQRIGVKYTLGLSATPFRKDGLTRVINWYLGDIIYRLIRKGSHNVAVKLFEYESTDKKFVETLQNSYNPHTKTKKQVPALQKMITSISKIDLRNKFVVSVLNWLRSNTVRCILVLSHRRDHLVALKTAVDELIIADEQAGVIDPGEYNTGYYVGGMKEYELTQSSGANMIFATYPMAAEGLDIPGLDTIVLSTPQIDNEQAIGRILRKPVEEAAVTPLVIDIKDMLSNFAKWGDKRHAYYTASSYKTDTYVAVDDACTSIADYLAKKNIPCDDLRQGYYTAKYGADHYELMNEIGFDTDGTEFAYEPTMNNIFKINDIVEDMRQVIKLDCNAEPTPQEIAQDIN